MPKSVTKTPRGREQCHVNGYTLGRLQDQAKGPTGAPVRLPLEFCIFAKKARASGQNVGKVFNPVLKLVFENYPFSCLSQLRSPHFKRLFYVNKHVLNQAIVVLRRSVGLPGQFVTVWKNRTGHTHTHTHSYCNPTAHVY